MEPVSTLTLTADVCQINTRDRIAAVGVVNGSTALAAIGANNILNVRPRREPAQTAHPGAQYYAASSAQVPISGGFHYGRVNLGFRTIRSAHRRWRSPPASC